MYQCMECGKKFRSTASAERATNRGCPGCGGVDVDWVVPSEPAKTRYAPTVAEFGGEREERSRERNA